VQKYDNLVEDEDSKSSYTDSNVKHESEDDEIDELKVKQMLKMKKD